MVMLSSLPGKAALIKSVSNIFRAQGWTVTAVTHDARVDLDIVKGAVRLFVACIDNDIQLFRSSAKLVEQMQDDTSSLKRLANRSLVFVLNFNIPGITLEQLAHRGIAALHLNECSVLTALDRFNDTLPPDPDLRQTVILEAHSALCLAIAEQYRGAGDYACAMNWIQRVLAARTQVSLATRRQFELLCQSGMTEAATKVAINSLEDRPGDLYFLRALRDLAQLRGDSSDAEQWSDKVDKATRRSTELKAQNHSPSFEEIIMKVSPKSTSEAPGDKALAPPFTESRKVHVPRRIHRLFGLLPKKR
jgi:hypothetical protein